MILFQKQMNSLINENTLLKDLVHTLENENESRNKERSLLAKQIDRLTHQNKKLLERCENHKIFQHENQKMKRIISELEGKVSELNSFILKKTQTEASNQELNKKIEQHQKIIHELEKQKSHQQQEWAQKLLKHNQILNEKQNQLSKKTAKIKNLQEIIQQMESDIKSDKIKELQNKKSSQLEAEQNIRRMNEQLSEQKRTNIKLLEQKFHFQQDLKKLSKLINLKQQEYQQQKLKQQSLISATIIEKQELLRRIELLEYEKKMCELSKTPNKTLQMSKVKQENRKLNATISKLKNGNKIQQSIEEESKSKDDDSDLKDMIKQLRNELIEVKQSHKKMTNQNEKMQKIISHHIISKGDRSDKPQIKNQKQIHHRKKRCSSRHDLHYKAGNRKQQSYLAKGYVSPQHDRKISLNTNHEKWENLQRKISILRQENDELKRTILQ